MRIKNTASRLAALANTNPHVTPVEHSRRPGSREFFFNSQGEINASSQQEVMATLGQLIKLAQSQQITFASNDDTKMSPAEEAEARQRIIAAFEDKMPRAAWHEIGAEVATLLKETIDRDGFMRTILKRSEVVQGSIPLYRVQRKQVVATVANGVASLAPQLVESNRVYAQEFTVTANVRVSGIDIAQTPGDFMDEKYNEGLEAIMKAEDLTLKALLDSTVGDIHPLIGISGGLTPAVLSAMKTRLTREGVPQGPILMAADYWDDILASNAFSGYVDPVTKLEMIRTGRLGTFYGAEFITDGFRPPALKVLEAGELYMLGQDEWLGAYTERGPVESTEIDGALQGFVGRGWFFSEILSMLVHNPAAVQKAVRVG